MIFLLDTRKVFKIRFDTPKSDMVTRNILRVPSQLCETELPYGPFNYIMKEAWSRSVFLIYVKYLTTKMSFQRKGRFVLGLLRKVHIALGSSDRSVSLSVPSFAEITSYLIRWKCAKLTNQIFYLLKTTLVQVHSWLSSNSELRQTPDTPNMTTFS